MNFVNSIFLSEYFEHITVSIVPVQDDKTKELVDYVSIRERETEFTFLPAELHDITHVNFQCTDFSKNKVKIELKPNSNDDIVIIRVIDGNEYYDDIIDIRNNNNSVIYNIPTSVIRNVIDAYYFVEEQIDKIKSTIDNKYNSLEETV